MCHLYHTLEKDIYYLPFLVLRYEDLYYYHKLRQNYEDDSLTLIFLYFQKSQIQFLIILNERVTINQILSSFQSRL